MEKVFLPFEVDKLNRLKKRLLDGKPSYLRNGNPSKEMLRLIWAKELIYSRIPKQYWTLKLPALKIDKEIKNVAKLYLKNYESAKSNGLGFILLGGNGLGKTSTACAIGIELLKRGLNVVYISAQTYMNFQMDFESEHRQTILDRLSLADLIIVDELDKLYMKRETNYALKAIENFFRENLNSNKMVIVCTNLPESEIKQSFNNSIYSLMQRHLKFLLFEGKDLSKIRKDNWEKMLQGDTKDVDLKIFQADAVDYYEAREGVKLK